MRKSETLGHDYFYSATRCGNCIVRSALPYDTHLKETLSGDYGYLYAAVLITLVLIVLFYYMSRRMGKTELNNQELQTKLQLEKEYNQYKYELSHNIAHELKTPVASVLGYLETIIDSRTKGNITDEQMTHFLERSYSQTQRLNALVQDISTLNKITGSRTVEKEEIDLSALVSGIIDEVALKLELQEMTVVNDLPKNLKLWCNASMVYSIFRNLTDNSIAYAGKGTQIHIGFYQEPVYGRTSRETTYYFSFYDNGPGIGEEHLTRIFERFYRVDKGRSRKLGGTGLGLAIVKNAVVMQGGSITAKNRPEGGLEFVFSLVG
jgi:signal transduction histidine kinase